MNELDRRGIAELEATGIPWAAVERWLDALDPREAFVARMVVKQVLQTLADDKAPLAGTVRGPRRAVPAADRRRHCRLRTTRPSPVSHRRTLFQKPLRFAARKRSRYQALSGRFLLFRNQLFMVHDRWLNGEAAYHERETTMPSGSPCTSGPARERPNDQQPGARAAGRRRAPRLGGGQPSIATRASAAPRDAISALASTS